MPREFKLPDLGEGIHEGEIVGVLIAAGDRVREEQPILEVETDKATVEIPSPYTGVVTAVLVKPGQVARVGDVLITFDDSEPKGAPDARPAAVASAVPPEGASVPAASDPPASGPIPARHGPVPATPATRQLARELGVDLRLVPPSGPGGRVTAENVRAYAARVSVHGLAPAGPAPAGPTPPAAAPAPTPVATETAPSEVSPTAPVAPAPPLPDFTRWGAVERVPVRSIRRATARHMALSWSQIPHVHHQDQADITELEAWRQRQKALVQAEGARLTLTAVVVKAAAAALKRFPMFNASYDTVADEIVLKRYYHIGVAADTERGLIVPVVQDVDRKSIAELALEMAALAERVRAGGATTEELRGGTFTVTNIGSLGGTGATPIINYPEVAILALGAARLQPVVRPTAGGGAEIVPRLMLPMTLGFDHRVADGADAARFMRWMIDALENPETLLLWV